VIIILREINEISAQTDLFTYMVLHDRKVNMKYLYKQRVI